MRKADDPVAALVLLSDIFVFKSIAVIIDIILLYTPLKYFSE